MLRRVFLRLEVSAMRDNLGNNHRATNPVKKIPDRIATRSTRFDLEVRQMRLMMRTGLEFERGDLVGNGSSCRDRARRRAGSLGT